MKGLICLYNQVAVRCGATAVSPAIRYGVYSLILYSRAL